MNLAAQPPKAFPHVLRPRVGVRLPRQHQPQLGQLSQTTQSTSPCLPLACLRIFLQMSWITCHTTGCCFFLLRQGWKHTGKRLGQTENGRTWQCRRNACPSGDHSFSSWSAAPLSPQTYKITKLGHASLSASFINRCLQFPEELTFLVWPQSPAGPLSQPRTTCLWRPYCKIKRPDYKFECITTTRSVQLC